MLVVEDEASSHGFYRRALPEAAVHVATTLAEARSLLEREGPFDAMLVDIGLPDGDGRDLVDEVMARQDRRPGYCAIISAQPTDEDRVKYGALGIPVVLKPPPMTKLRSELGMVLEGIAAERAEREMLRAAARANEVDQARQKWALTPTQCEVLAVSLRGLFDHAAADAMGFSIENLRKKEREIWRASGADSYVALVMEIVRRVEAAAR